MRYEKSWGCRALCDVDTPPPTTEELIWFKGKLIEHQQSVQRWVGSIPLLAFNGLELK